MKLVVFFDLLCKGYEEMNFILFFKDIDILFVLEDIWKLMFLNLR